MLLKKAVASDEKNFGKDHPTTAIRYSNLAAVLQDLGDYEVFFGDYKKMFDAPAEYSKVTVDDVKRVANLYFKKSNRTVGILQSNVED